ncbi:DUF2937 family protein [Pacificibacter marinus]|uniref:DUF2937 domain-containing protein n=1 Tax=Pacificibacter marinus TaxID=658057 RepID=A0A1Y5SJE0_9RHOB|nr:DUF2937 family protein [Pacificibacter marinus]SEK59831.1 Protein of unknown function [Pacificibacter marinus]SLN42235.1 hypothetical protein PAM7971_02000 [Pacificibacter marinus]
MIIKTLTLVGGMFGAAIVSQFPEFTQQYMQRLGGQVDALSVVIGDFDNSANKADMTRVEALASMGGSVFMDNRRRDMRATIARHARLSGDLQRLSDASPLERISMPHRLRDVNLVSATYTDFQPALPLTVEGGISAAGGFLIGWGGIAAVLHFMLWPFRRRRPKFN